MPARRRCVAAAVAGALCGCARAASAVTCSASGPLAPLARVNVSIVSGGRPRYFWLTLPAGFGNASAQEVPLMLVFHGAASTALDFLDGGPSRISSELPPSVATHLDAAGAAAGFAVAAPQAAQAGLVLPRLPRWRNDTSRAAADAEEPTARVAAAEDAAGEGVDDVAFAWDVAACVRDVLPGLRGAISSRVHVAGWSQGAKLASLVACTPRRNFSAAAVVIGAGLHDAPAEPGERCAAPVPLLMLQGGLDAVMPFCDAGAFYQAGWRALRGWAAAVNGCGAGPWRPLCAGNGSSSELLRVYVPARGCAPAAPTALYWMPQMAHTVPSGLLPGLDGDFAALVVAFFRSAIAGAPDAMPLRARPGGGRMEPCPVSIAARFLQPCTGAVPWPLSALMSA